MIRQAGKLKNVNLVEQDITGGLIEGGMEKDREFLLFQKTEMSLEAIISLNLNPDFDPGMVISLNILTQLESQLVDWLKRGQISNEEDFLISGQEYRKAILIF